MEPFDKSGNGFSFRDLNQINGQRTNHDQGTKFVFYPNEELNNHLTQIAIGILEPGATVEEHMHLTMDEYFYIWKDK